jgi:hypothetical protein
MLNDITWVKPNPPPNLSCRYFTHATETVIWAGRDKKCRHKFNYALMRHLNGGKQMTSVWTIEAPRREEKVFGKHPTQKSLALLERIIAASSDENDLVLDPFSGSGTTGIAAARLGRAYTGVERDEAFLRISACRIIGVPQADSPERILNTVRTHSLGITAEEELAASLGVSERQIHYYRQAAMVLGFLSRTATGWNLTDAGCRLCAADSRAAPHILASTILGHPLVQMAARRSRTAAYAGGARESVAALLHRTSALGESTSRRRAQTLLAWIEWAKDRMGGQENLFHDFPPTSEEPHDAAVA